MSPATRTARLILLVIAVLGSVGLWLVGLAVAGPGVSPRAGSVNAEADAETPPVSGGGDSADDPAIWIHPTDRTRSLVIGTDQSGALDVYDLNGDLVQHVTGLDPNNVDVRDNLVGAGDEDAGALRFFWIDPATGRLSNAGTVVPGFPPFGFCMYKGAGGKVHAFTVSRSGGRIEQWELDTSGATVRATKRRQWSTGSRSEGCVADDATGRFYVSEEATAIWEYGAEPDDSTTTRVMVDRANSVHIAKEVEGLAIAGDYLIASSQFDDSYAVYDKHTRAFVRQVRVVQGSDTDGCEHTDGIEAALGAFGPRYPNGLFVCQDFSNTAPGPSGHQNFKFVGLHKLVDAAAPPAPAPAPAPPPVAPPPPVPAPPDDREQAFISLADATLKASSPTKNYGTKTTLQASGASAKKTARSFLRFDLSSLAGPIRSAALVLKSTAKAKDGGRVLAVDGAWNETGVTFATAPSVQGAPVLGAWPRSVAKKATVRISLDAGALSAGIVTLVLDGGKGASYSSREEKKSAYRPQLLVTTG